MKLREFLEPVSASQMVRIVDGFEFVCDICGGLSKRNTELLSKYLDRNVALMYPSICKDENDEIMIYFHVRLDVDNNMSENVDIMPCVCGGGKPELLADGFFNDYRHRLICNTCGKTLRGYIDISAAVKDWNKWMKELSGGEE